MSAAFALVEGGLTAGVSFVMSALFETSLLGSGVGCAHKLGPSATKITAREMKRASDFMRRG